MLVPRVNCLIGGKPLLLLENCEGCKVLNPSGIKSFVENGITEDHICVGVGATSSFAKFIHPVFFTDLFGYRKPPKDPDKVTKYWFIEPNEKPVQIEVSAIERYEVSREILHGVISAELDSWRNLGITAEYWHEYKDVLLSWRRKSLIAPLIITFGLSGNASFQPKETLILDLPFGQMDEIEKIRQIQQQIGWLSTRKESTIKNTHWYDLELPVLDSSLFKVHIGTLKKPSVSLDTIKSSLDDINASLIRLNSLISLANKGADDQEYR